MKFALVITGLFLSTFCYAKTKSFDIQIKEVTVNGTLDVQPKKVNVNPNQTVVISRSFNSSGVNTIVEMTVVDDNSKLKDGILIKLSIIEEKDGTKKVIGTPQMIVKSGYEAQMTLGEEDGKTPDIKISLAGTRIQ